MNYKAFFFDLYGTLFIFGDMDAAWNDWAEAYFESVNKFCNHTNKEIFYKSLNGFFNKPKPAILNPKLTVYEHRIKNQCESINLDLTVSQLQIVAADSVTAWQKYIRLDNETIPVLKELKKNYALALVTNFDHPPHIYSLLSDLELTPLFNEIIISGEVGIDKPDPEIFISAFSKLNLTAEEVLFVGDSVEDMEGAKAAGLVPVLIKRTREKDDLVIVDFHTDSENSNRFHREPSREGITEISKLSELYSLTNMD